MNRIQKFVENGRFVGLIDAEMLNGSSEPLIEELLKKRIFFRLGAYAGWNTTANSSGTVVAHSVIVNTILPGTSEKRYALRQLKFLLNRLADDYIYSSVVRGEMARRSGNPTQLYYSSGAGRELKTKMSERFGELAGRYLIGQTIRVVGSPGWKPVVTDAGISKIYLPWGRLFEACVATEFEIERALPEALDG